METPAEQQTAPRASAKTAVDIRHVDIDGLRLRVGIRPGNSRPMLLFNGIGASFDIAEPFIDALDDMELIIFDMPGSGGSATPLFPKRFSSLAKLSVKLLDALGYRGAVNVAGVSWGGALAQQFALQFPGRTNRLVLAATSAGLAALPAKPGVLMRLATARRYMSRRYLAEVAPEIYGGFARRRPELVERHGALIRKPSRRGYLYQLLAGLGWTSVHKLHRLRCPTLIMGGDDDPIMPLINMRLLHWLIPKSYMHIVRGGGHLFIVMRANESAAVIRGFIRERRHDGTDPQNYRVTRGQSTDQSGAAAPHEAGSPFGV